MKHYDLKSQSGTTESLVILLHGLGANGRDLMPLAEAWAPLLPDTAFVSPDAPFPCDMAPGMPESYQWFSAQDWTEDSLLEGTQSAAPILDEFIDDQLKTHTVKPGKLVLVGFSQGCMMSLYVGPRRKDKIAGIIGYSGVFIGGELLEPGQYTKPPVLIMHGDADPVVPPKAYNLAREGLGELGFDVTGEMVRGMAHGIDPHCVQMGADFLRKVL